MTMSVEFLARSVHGGPLPSASQLRDLLDDLRVQPPLWVVAVQGIAGKTTLNGWTILNWHAGISYFVAPRRFRITRLSQWVQSQGGMHGKPQTCEDVSDFIRTIQRSIIALRRVELGAGDELDQDSLQRLAVKARASMCGGEEGWRFTVQTWLYAVFEAYHQRAINIIRRQVLEFVTSCSCRYPVYWRDLNFLVSEVITLSGNIFVLGKLRDRLLDTLLLIGQCMQTAVMNVKKESELSPAIARVWSLLQLQYRDKVRVNTLAVAVGLSEGHVSRQFRAEVGITIRDALIALRLSHARELLLQSMESILSIGLDSGFPSVEHFQRTFKKVHGISPNRWRKQTQ